MERKDAVAIRERAAGMTSLRIIRDDRPPTQIITQIENPPQPRVVVTQEELAPMARAANANLALERKRETWSRLVGLCAEINALGDLEFDALVEVLQPHEMRADVIQSARTRLTEAALAVERLEACREREWTGGGDRAGLH